MASTEDRMDTSMGEELGALRERILGSRAGVKAADLTPSERTTFGDGLRAAIQVDLDRDPEANSELEDPNLVAHIAAQRRVLQEHQNTLARIPTRGHLNTQYVAAMGTMSATVEDLGASLRNVDDWAILAGKAAANVKLISAAGTPRNAPTNPWKVFPEGATEFLEFFEKSAEATASRFDQTKNIISGCHRNIFKLRRDFECVIDGLMRRVDALESERQRTREHLRDVARSAN